MQFHQLDILVAPFRRGDRAEGAKRGFCSVYRNGCRSDGRPLTTRRPGPRGCRKLCGPGDLPPALRPHLQLSSCSGPGVVATRVWKLCLVPPHSGSCAFSRCPTAPWTARRERIHPLHRRGARLAWSPRSELWGAGQSRGSSACTPYAVSARKVTQRQSPSGHNWALSKTLPGLSHSPSGGRRCSEPASGPERRDGSPP